MRSALALQVVVSLAVSVTTVSAQPASHPLLLDVDNCPHSDASDADLRKQGAEHYTRGETLYLQGDYKGAVSELVQSYCKIPSFGYSILKDIGQAYERDLDYERAVAYLQRYIDEMPENATRTSQCAPDPKEDRENVTRRIAVLKRLKARILIETQPGGATITIERKSDGRVVERGIAGDPFDLEAGEYTMRISLRGFVPVSKPLVAHIGKPDTRYIPLDPQTGTVSILTTPSDAKIYLDDGRVDRLVGVGRYETRLDAKKYRVRAERPGRETRSKEIEVLPDQVSQALIELPEEERFGRRQLIAFVTGAGMAAGGNLLAAFNQTTLAGAGVIGGGIAGFTFSYLYLPKTLALGTSNLTITSTLAGGVVGGFGALVFTDDPNVYAPVLGASLAIGGAAGYYFGDKTKVSVGDAALINSAMTWGTVTGALFAESFGSERQVSSGLVLSGFGMGAISGVLMTRYFHVSRTHALLIDVGGVIGILGGLAAESLIYGASSSSGGAGFTDAEREHLSNFSLGGMAVGLIGAGILSRNVDAPKLQKTQTVQPAVGSATTVTGARTTTFGIAGRW